MVWLDSDHKSVTHIAVICTLNIYLDKRYFIMYRPRDRLVDHIRMGHN